jgi:SIR2-like domain
MDIKKTGAFDDFFNTFLAVVEEEDFTATIKGFLNKWQHTIPAYTDAVSQLNKEYKKGNLVPVLGAGISAGFGLPGWNDLIQQLAVSTLELGSEQAKATTDLFFKLFPQNPLVIGRYLQTHFEERKTFSFEQRVRDILYAKADKTLQLPVMKEVINLCVSAGKRHDVNAVITYNFDDVLESKLTQLDITHTLVPVFSNEHVADNDCIPIYHVHGYLPEDATLTANHTITLGERVYHKQYTDIYNWSNIVQLTKFREKNCFFIGTSLTDPNTRRLLDIANTHRGNGKVNKHYLIRKQTTLEEMEKNLTGKEDADKFKPYLPLLHQLYKKYLEIDAASLGVNTIWVNDYSKHYADTIRAVSGD